MKIISNIQYMFKLDLIKDWTITGLKKNNNKQTYMYKVYKRVNTKKPEE